MNSSSEQIRDAVLKKYPSATVDVESFPSGAEMVDVRWSDRLFVCAFSPTHGFGIDEVHENEGLDSSYRHAARDGEEALAKLFELMESN